MTTHDLKSYADALWRKATLLSIVGRTDEAQSIRNDAYKFDSMLWGLAEKQAGRSGVIYPGINGRYPK